MSDVTDAYLGLPRALSKDGRHPQSVREYQRAIDALTAANEPEGIVVAKLELFLALLETGDVDAAQSAFAALHEDAERFGVQLSEFETFTMPLLLRVAQGDEALVLEELQGFLNQSADTINLVDLVSVLRIAAYAHEHAGSPLQAAYSLQSIAQAYELAAREYGPEAGLGTDVAEAFWEHAQYLIKREAAIVAELTTGLVERLNTDEGQEWETLVRECLGGSPDDTPEVRVHHAVMRSLDESDSWGPVPVSLRAGVGRCRVYVRIRLFDYPGAVHEARRVLPLAQRAGWNVLADRLQAVAELDAWDQDGPDFGFDRG